MTTTNRPGTSGEQREPRASAASQFPPQSVPAAFSWRPIDTAPRDGTRILGRRTYADLYTGKLKYERRRTYWGKTSHVPIYGWNYGRDPEDQNLWQPTHWKPL